MVAFLTLMKVEAEISDRVAERSGIWSGFFATAIKMSLVSTITLKTF